MKKYFEGVMKWLTAACAMFTAAMLIYLIVCLFQGAREVSTAALWWLFWVCAAGSLIQAVCFSDWIIRKMRYTWRSVLFVALFLPALSAAAWKLEFFPTSQPGWWLTFICIFFLIFLAFTIGFEVYFHITGRKYDGLIGQYRKKKEDEERND